MLKYSAVADQDPRAIGVGVVAVASHVVRAYVVSRGDC